MTVKCASYIYLYNMWLLYYSVTKLNRNCNDVITSLWNYYVAV